MIRASLSGRLGGDPIRRATRSGKAMITASVAVNVARSGEEAATEWIGLVTFGTTGELLAAGHCKGDVVAAMGTLTRETFTDREGNKRTSWSLVIEAILSARTVRNEPARSRNASASARPRTQPPIRSFHSGSRVSGHGAELPADSVDDLYRDLVP
jgi:single-strand DNA-binding protein